MVARRSLRHVRAVVISSVVGLVVAPGVAEAHTEFDYSLPTDGASVGVPVDEITVAFTSPVSLVGNGFAVLDPQNNELAPFAVTDDDTVFRLQLDPPLAGGTVAVRYEVRAEDGHVLAGSFVFDVDAPAPTTSPSTTITPTATTSRATAPPTASTTTPAAATTTPSTSATITRASDDTISEQVDEADGDGGSGNGIAIAIAIAAAIALAAGGFLLVRSRKST